MARAIELLRAGIGKPAGRFCGEVERLRKKVDDLEQLAGVNMMFRQQRQREL